MDSSGFSAADQASGEPAETEVNIGMKPEYHNGAAKDKIEVFKDIPEPLDHLLTPNRNTILHIHLTSLITRSEDSESKDLGPEVSESSTAFVREMKGPEDLESPTAFVEEILRMCPSLLWKDFSYSQNEAGETPLYIAVERNFEDVAFHILDNCTSPAHDGPLGRTPLHACRNNLG